jgi:hypothetical protein
VSWKRLYIDLFFKRFQIWRQTSALFAPGFWELRPFKDGNNFFSAAPGGGTLQILQELEKKVFMSLIVLQV